MTVSAIVCTRDRAESLKSFFESARAVDPGPSGAEWVIVDNGSSDHTREVVDAFRPAASMPVRYVFEPEVGLSRARNAGVASSSGDVVLFTDDDVRVPPDWVKRMASTLEDADAVVGGIVIAPQLLRPWMTPRLRVAVGASTELLDPHRPQTMIGANMGLRREALEAAGGFDEALGAGTERGAGEDSWLALRLRGLGRSIRGNLDCAVDHHFDASRLRRESLIRLAQRAGRADAYVISRQPGVPRVPSPAAVFAHDVRLRFWRRSRRLAAEGITEREFDWIVRAEYARAIRLEMKSLATDGRQESSTSP